MLSTPSSAFRISTRYACGLKLFASPSCLKSRRANQKQPSPIASMFSPRKQARRSIRSHSVITPATRNPRGTGEPDLDGMFRQRSRPRTMLVPDDWRHRFISKPLDLIQRSRSNIVALLLHFRAHAGHHVGRYLALPALHRGHDVG